MEVQVAGDRVHKADTSRALWRRLVEGTFSGLDVTNPVLEVTLHFQIIQGGEAVAVGETTVKAPGTDFDWEGEAAPGTRRATDGDALALGFAVIVKPRSFETHTWSQIKP